MSSCGWLIVSDFYRAGGKRVFDVVASGLLLLATSPVQAAVGVAIALTNGRPVLFTQDRPGRDGEVFRLWKFRSMRAERFPGEPDAARLTSLGRFLRSTSLDELPELWNVFKGDMSLVGPRPLRVSYLGRYTPRQARRHEIRPGITGLAQVSGRNLLTWDERFELDVNYVDTCSLGLDCLIIGRTLLEVAKRTGISADGAATMTPFLGSPGD